MLKMIRQWLQTLHVPSEHMRAATAVATRAPTRRAPASSDACDPFDPLAVRRRFAAGMLGVGHWLEQPPNAYERLVLSELDGLQGAWHRHEQLLPRLPQVLPELLRTLRDPDATLGKLVAIVGRDPVLVAAVTRTVNSAWFRTARPVMQLRDAVLLIGQDGLRRLLPTVALQPIFHSGGGRFCTLAGPHVWAHAQRSALAGMVLANGKTDVAAFEHYLAGMALGASLIIVVRTLDAQQTGDATLCSTRFADAMLHESRGLAVRIAGQWDFPPGTIAVLQTLAADASGAGDGGILQSAEYLAMVRALAHAGHLDDDLAAMQMHLPGIAAARAQRCYSQLLRFDEADAMA